MNLVQLIVLAIVQGMAELLPVSSSAHVILAQHFLGLDPSAPEMTFLLVMLHTGTMFAVLLYFGARWKALLFNSQRARPFLKALIVATAVTGILGLSLKLLIEKLILERWLGHSKGEVENLFKVLPLVASALLVAGCFIIFAGLRKQKGQRDVLKNTDAVKVGLIQGLSLPFRGFSRSGSTISMALIEGISRVSAEEFSFALAVVLTPPVVFLELKRLLGAHAQSTVSLSSLMMPGLTGMVFSFLAGLVALKWLSAWLEAGRWHYFGYYCVALSAVVLGVHFL